MDLKLAVVSGKGGTGKTMFSTNLAVYLSDFCRVFLVDCDVEEPDCRLFIEGDIVNVRNVQTRYPEWQQHLCTHCNQCYEVCNYSAIIPIIGEIVVFPGLCHSCHACSELCEASALPMRDRTIGSVNHYENGAVTLVEGKLNVGEPRSVPVIAECKSYVATIAGDSSVSIIDSPPGNSCPLMETVEDVDYVIVVAEPTPFGLHDFLLTVETLRKLDKDFGVVINRSGTGFGDLNDYCEKEKLDVLTEIPDDLEVARLYSKGILAINELPGFQVYFEGICDRILRNRLMPAV